MTVLDRFRLDGKVAVVTGALGNIGPIWAGALLDAGAKVAALDLRTTPLPPSLSQLEGIFGPSQLTVFEGDVTSREGLERVAKEIEHRLGAVDVLVNNAGVDTPPSATGETFAIADYDPEVFRHTLDVNVLGAFQCTQVFGPGMVARGHGSIVNIGSLYASVSPDARFYDHLATDPPFLKPPAYGASKAALLNLTTYLAAHWGPSGVRVNALSPGGVEGGQDAQFKSKFSARVPLGRLCRPDELQGALLFLASDSSSYVTGIDLRVDGGFLAW